MRAAIYQHFCRDGDAHPARRIAALRRAAFEARAGGVDLLICPELFLTGYNISEDEIREHARGGDLIAAARGIAGESGVALVVGYPEERCGALHIAATAIAAGGKILANFRKLHLSGAREKKIFRQGEKFALFRAKEFTVGILICYDLEFPEAARTLALAGAELIAAPTALRVRYAHLARNMPPTRAFDDGVFVAYANYAGREGDWRYCGASSVAAPDGEILARAGHGRRIIFADLDKRRIKTARRELPYHADRRPPLYRRAPFSPSLDMGRRR